MQATLHRLYLFSLLEKNISWISGGYYQMTMNTNVSQAMKIHLGEIYDELPSMPDFADKIRRAPARHFNLNQAEAELALKNALRYIPEKWHQTLAPEFMEELVTRGRIYGYRFRPPGPLKGQPIDSYKGKCI